MNSTFQYLVRVAVPRFGVSLFSGAFCYAAWLVLFLASRPYHIPVFRRFLELLAPIATAVGLSTGAVLFTRLRHLDSLPASRSFGYPVIACLIGGSAGFPFGPMPFVLAICSLGSVGMFLVEMTEFRRFRLNRESNSQSPEPEARQGRLIS